MRNKCFIGTIILSVLVLFGIWNHDSLARLVSGVVAHNHTSALSGGSTLGASGSPITILGSLLSNKPCVTNFIRKTPNYCHLDQSLWGTVVSLTRDVCHTIPSIPSDAKALILRVHSRITGSNAVGSRTLDATVYTDAACTENNRSIVEARIQEFVASLNILQNEIYVFTWPITTGGPASLLFTDDAVNNGSIQYALIGYLD